MDELSVSPAAVLSLRAEIRKFLSFLYRIEFRDRPIIRLIQNVLATGLSVCHKEAPASKFVSIISFQNLRFPRPEKGF